MKIFHIREYGLGGVELPVVLLNDACLEGGKVGQVTLGRHFDRFCVGVAVLHLLLAPVSACPGSKEQTEDVFGILGVFSN
jgi:hypothetical protein